MSVKPNRWVANNEDHDQTLQNAGSKFFRFGVDPFQMEAKNNFDGCRHCKYTLSPKHL